jgi:aromatic ring-opening dioxygenase catalytic subunit (LigB family)
MLFLAQTGDGQMKAADAGMTDMKRQPAIYVTHGAGPCFWINFAEPLGPNAFDGLKSHFAGLLAGLPQRPRAILVVSAHWEERIPTVSTAAVPSMLYDYFRFPPHTYELQYPAPGSPELAVHVCDLLQSAGIDVGTDDRRGFDHGVFVPMLVIDPQAGIPVVMLSLCSDLDPAHHLAIGAALAPLRDEGVLIIGSGSSFHNLRTLFNGDSRASVEFDAWLHDTISQTDPVIRKARFVDWKDAPSARSCHPREDHLIPLMVVAGAAGSDPGRGSFRGLVGGKAYSCFAFGA